MMPSVNPAPDSLPAARKKEEQPQRRGTLKVFLGMCAGVGKTYTMLEAAQKARREGRDVLVGYVETHGRRETEALTEGLPILPRKPVVHRGVTLTEMDLDAVLARRPQLVLADELAHTNAPGSRHPKRFQDVIEILDAGIDVYTTLNVQHIESRSDTVREITGAPVRETVPDTVLANADLELVDLSPEDLLQRLAEGKVYVPERAEDAARNFLREGNLIALREMALRLAAERVGQDVRDYMQARRIAGPWKTGHRLMVAVSSSPYSEALVRWTRRLADSLGSTWIAAYIETSRVLPEDEQARLTHTLAMARSLGAEIRSTTDEDFVSGLLRIARGQNVTQIVVGTPSSPLAILSPGLRRLYRLIREAGGIDVHVVRVADSARAPRQGLWRRPADAEWPQYVRAVGAVAAVTVLNLALAALVGPRSVGLIFLMTVVGLALFLNRGPVYVAATISALIWNFFFLPPPLTFHIGRFEDLMMFAMYFVVALAMGHLISRIRAKERMDRRREERAAAMYLLTLELGDASGWDEIERAVENNVQSAFKAEGSLLLADEATRTLRGSALPEREFGAAVWAYEHVQPAGRFTDTLPMLEAMYLPLHTGGRPLGVLRLKWRQTSPPTIEQRTMLDGFQRHISLVVDRQRLREDQVQSRVLAESERLSQALLSAVSHELRTPLAAIETAASGWQPGLRAETQSAFALEIRQATRRLSRLVGNLLDMARLESGHVRPVLDWCDIHDLVQSALKRAGPELASREVSVRVPPRLPLLRADFRLIEQALVDLLLNAAIHTPAGTPVEVSAAAGGGKVEITVADRGTGVPADVLPRIFDKFFRAPGAAAGGTGLGLSIVKGFVGAHGGHVQAANRAAGGAVFTIELPLQELPHDEPE